jgi:hypothetical protein
MQQIPLSASENRWFTLRFLIFIILFKDFQLISQKRDQDRPIRNLSSHPTFCSSAMAGGVSAVNSPP